MQYTKSKKKVQYFCLWRNDKILCIFVNRRREKVRTFLEPTKKLIIIRNIQELTNNFSFTHIGLQPK